MKEAIFNYLESSPKAVKRPELLFHLRGLGFECSDREMRATIEQMVVHDEYLIGSSEKGYAVIKTQEEMETAMKYMNAKAEAIAVRKNCFMRNWKNKHKEEFQTTLF